MLRYENTYHDPETGDEIDIFTDDGLGVRNARDHRSSSGGQRQPPPSRREIAVRRRPLVPRAPGGYRPAPPPAVSAAPVAPPSPAAVPNVHSDGNYVSVKKDALLGLISLGGEFWASYLGRPDMPQPTGHTDTDLVNASLHRDALALHTQNRDRIRALTGLAERAAKLLLS